ncbi:MAG TPA: hypothetical protein VFT83_05445 [Nitrososphaeraceae archaeon]|nr:hypothetical protein [Nitrososphaeraceae archaeon]HEU5172958.1 hypothetical protein [Nitrososphaeraceae archaeon]
MSEEKDSLDNIVLTKINNPSKSNDLISFSLSLKINARIRKLFNQSLWEKAYNKFDNTFRITINVDLKSGNKILYSIKFVKKAVFFWTRNPRIPHRIWIFIVKDDSPFYPESEEEAKSLLFDIEKIIELKPSMISKKSSKIYANVKISWGRHNFTEPTKLEGKSNEEEIQLIFS